MSDWRLCVEDYDVPGRVALVALVGSHAYGTNRPDSDYDYRGFYVAPTERLFDLDGRSVVDGSFTRDEPDLALHEVGKFCRLAAAANPTVLEVLWAEPVNMDGSMGAGAMLRANRKVFLSKRVLKTYGGYAMGQLRQAAVGTGGSRGQAHLRREKFKLHTLRLMRAGIYALRTGDLQVRVEDPKALWAEATQSLAYLERVFAGLDTEMRVAAQQSPLPDEPDYDGINLMLRTIRNLNRQGA